MKKFKYIVGLLVLAVFFGVIGVMAFNFFGLGGSAHWKEEVLLHEGTKIIVKRSQTRGGRGEIGQSPIREHSITFTLPGSNKRITWKDEFSKDVGHSNFDLLALHILNDTPYIVTSSYGCLSYNKWGRPNPPYIFFRYDGDVWQRVHLSDFPDEFKEINMVINASAHEKKLVRQWLASVEMINKLNSSLKQPEFKTIIRSSLETGKNSASDVDCPEEIYNGNGGWLGLDWFTSKQTYKECLEVCKSQKISTEYCPCDNLLKTSPKWR
jgi:hypothetical protein